MPTESETVNSMPGNYTLWKWFAVLARFTVVVWLVGLLVGAAFWAVLVTTLFQQNIISVFRGDVEDGLGLFAGFLILGGMCGAGVGFCYGCYRVILRAGPPLDDLNQGQLSKH